MGTLHTAVVVFAEDVRSTCCPELPTKWVRLSWPCAFYSGSLTGGQSSQRQHLMWEYQILHLLIGISLVWTKRLKHVRHEHIRKWTIESQTKTKYHKIASCKWPCSSRYTPTDDSTQIIWHSVLIIYSIRKEFVWKTSCFMFASEPSASRHLFRGHLPDKPSVGRMLRNVSFVPLSLSSLYCSRILLSESLSLKFCHICIFVISLLCYKLLEGRTSGCFNDTLSPGSKADFWSEMRAQWTCFINTSACLFYYYYCSSSFICLPE